MFFPPYQIEFQLMLPEPVSRPDPIVPVNVHW